MAGRRRGKRDLSKGKRGRGRVALDSDEHSTNSASIATTRTSEGETNLKGKRGRGRGRANLVRFGRYLHGTSRSLLSLLEQDSSTQFPIADPRRSVGIAWYQIPFEHLQNANIQIGDRCKPQVPCVSTEPRRKLEGKTRTRTSLWTCVSNCFYTIDSQRVLLFIFIDSTDFFGCYFQPAWGTLWQWR